jgi:hypothetical protein
MEKPCSVKCVWEIYMGIKHSLLLIEITSSGT